SVHTPIGQFPPASLAVRAVLERSVGEGHLGDRGPAHRTSPARAAVDGESALLRGFDLPRRQAAERLPGGSRTALMASSRVSASTVFAVANGESFAVWRISSE